MFLLDEFDRHLAVVAELRRRFRVAGIQREAEIPCRAGHLRIVDGDQRVLRERVLLQFLVLGLQRRVLLRCRVRVVGVIAAQRHREPPLLPIRLHLRVLQERRVRRQDDLHALPRSKPDPEHGHRPLVEVLDVPVLAAPEPEMRHALQQRPADKLRRHRAELVRILLLDLLPRELHRRRNVFHDVLHEHRNARPSQIVVVIDEAVLAAFGVAMRWVGIDDGVQPIGRERIHRAAVADEDPLGVIDRGILQRARRGADDANLPRAAWS